MPPTNTAAAALSIVEVTALADRLRAAAAAYYSGDGVQLMDDATYDNGIRTLRSVSTAHNWHGADDLLHTVAAGQSGGDIPHAIPMLSLDNAMNGDELAAFFDRVSTKTGVTPDKIAWVVEPKFDGMALSVRYHDGMVSQIVTRGNGLVGETVGHVARHVAGIPAKLPNEACVTVVGECVMTHDDFVEANRMRLEHGDRPFANPRNAVAGSLRAKNRTYRVSMTFIAYGAHAPTQDPTAYTTDPMPERYSTTILRLSQMGFKTAKDMIGEHPVTYGPIWATSLAALIERDRATFPMDIDGAVIKADDPTVREAMGENSHHPRWAIARKFDPDTRETDLLDIEVAVGRTGNLSFTAKVAPVAVGGTTISSVTVHNVSEITRKGLRLPGPDGAAQRVIIRRAGEVIPEIVGVAATGPGESQTRAFTPPTQCPNGHPIEKDGIIWRCSLDRNCTIDAGIRYAVSRDCLDIEGIGTQIVSALIQNGTVSDIADLFSLTMTDLIAVPRLGEANATKILAQIQKAKTLPLARIITALGLRGTGRSMSRRIAAHFGTMNAIRKATVEQIAEVEGLGPIKAPSIVEELTELAPILDRLEEINVGVTHNNTPNSPTGTGATTFDVSAPSLAGKSVCVTGAMTGALAGMSRNEVNELIESLGGRAASSVSAKTDLLLTDDPESGTGKAKKARELGVEIISPDEFAGRYIGGN